MLNIDSIMKKTKKFSESQDGQNKVKMLREKAFDENRQFGTTRKGGIVSKEDFKRVAQEFLQQIIKSCAENPLASSGTIATVRKIVEDNKTISSADKVGRGTYRVSVDFDDTALRRESLIETKFGGRTGDGIDNILALLNNGMDTATGKAPWGFWETHGDILVHALAHREPLNFMQDAMREFLSKYEEKYVLKSLDTGEEYKD